MHSLRHTPLLGVLLVVAGCPVDNPGVTPPTDRFHFPVSLAVSQPQAGGSPVLYVVSSNFDLRYNRGTVHAVDLGKLGDVPDGDITPGVDPEHGYVHIGQFAGTAGVYPVPGATDHLRLFVPVRADNRLHVLEAQGAQVTCANPRADAGRDWLRDPLELASPEDDLVKAQDPCAAGVRGREVYVSHIGRVRNDAGDYGESFLVRFDAENLGPLSFLPIGVPTSEALAAAPGAIYFTGRSVYNEEPQPLRVLLDDGTVLDVGLDDETRLKEARGVAVSSDARRVFIATRGPDASSSNIGQGPDGLLIVDVTTDPWTGRPKHRASRFVPMPAGPSEVLAIPRVGARDLVAVSCTRGNAVAFYDDGVGEVVSVVEDIDQPFGLAHTARPTGGERVFVAGFGDHLVHVIDIPDPANGRTAIRVGRLGNGTHPPAESEEEQ